MLKMKKQIMITYPSTSFTSIAIPQLKKKNIKETKKQDYVMKLFITSHNKNQ